MRISAVPTANLFVADAVALMNGFARIVSHLLSAPIERIAEACDVGGVLASRRAWRRAGLHRVAGRESWRSRRRRGLFGCLHYLGELT